MSIDDESHGEPSPPTPSRVGGDQAAPRALSIDEEWAVIMALEEERGRAHAAEPTPVASPAPTHEDLSYLEPIVYPGANDPVNPWRTHGAVPIPEDNGWHCLIHALYVVCVRRMNPSVGFHIGAAIAAFVASSVAAFVCVWMFVTAVNLGALPGS